MNPVYNGRKYKIFSRVKVPKGFRKSSKGYIYFIRVNFPDGLVWHKIGKTNDILERMKEHAAGYAKCEKGIHGIPTILIIWVSAAYEETTAFRIERKMKEHWIAKCPDWVYIENDRFIIPDYVQEVSIKVRKTWTFSL